MRTFVWILKIFGIFVDRGKDRKGVTMKNVKFLWVIAAFMLVFAIVLTGCPHAAASKSSHAPISGNVIWYTVDFDLNGGTGTVPLARTVEKDCSINLPDESGFSNDPFTFGGWNTKDDGTGTNYTADFNFVVQNKTTFYVKWISEDDICTITFKANGGTGTPPGSLAVASGTYITIPGKGSLDKTGYDFSGWSELTDGTAPVYFEDDFLSVADDMDFSAIWIDTSEACTVTFDINGGSGKVPNPLTVEKGDVIMLPRVLATSGTKAKGLLQFDGWNTNAAGTGTDYAAGDSFTVNEDVTLYAQWIVPMPELTPLEATVSFNINGGTGTAPDSIKGEIGKTITLPKGKGFKKGTGRDTLIFTGWNEKADGTGECYEAGGDYLVVKDIELFADWELFTKFVDDTDDIEDIDIDDIDIDDIIKGGGGSFKYIRTVTFLANGASGTVPDPVKALTGSSITLPDKGLLIAPKGKVFWGWNTNALGTGTNYEAGESYTVTANVELYAQWESSTVVRPPKERDPPVEVVPPVLEPPVVPPVKY